MITLNTVPIETLSFTDEASGIFEGYGAVYNKNIPRIFGTIKLANGIFAESLAKGGAGKVRMLWDHDESQPIGKWEAMHEDSKGLFVRGRLLVNDVAKAREVYALMKNQAIGGLSVGFSEAKTEKLSDGTILIKSAKLNEISAVTFPAEEDAIISHVHSKDFVFDDIRELECFLRNSGIPKRAAKAIARHGFSGISHGCDAQADLIMSGNGCDAQADLIMSGNGCDAQAYDREIVNLLQTLNDKLRGYCTHVRTNSSPPRQ